MWQGGAGTRHSSVTPESRIQMLYWRKLGRGGGVGTRGHGGYYRIILFYIILDGWCLVGDWVTVGVLTIML